MTTSGEPRSVSELMTRDPIVVGIDTPLADAAEVMDFYRVSGLPVVGEDGRLVGVISQTDLLHARTNQALWQAWPGLAVRHLMTEPAVSILANASVAEAADLMERLYIHRLVVIDPVEETPIGVLSLTDLVHAMAERGEG